MYSTREINDQSVTSAVTYTKLKLFPENHVVHNCSKLSNKSATCYILYRAFSKWDKVC